MPDTQELIEALENLERYLRDTPHHNAIETAAAREVLSRVRSADEQGDERSPLDWRVIAKSAGENGVRYRTNGALEKFLADIGVLTAPPDDLVEVVARALCRAHNEDPDELVGAATPLGDPMDYPQWMLAKPVAQAVLQALSPHLSEREKIVAWLLRHHEGELSNNLHTQMAAKSFADAISRGDHISGEGR